MNSTARIEVTAGYERQQLEEQIIDLLPDPVYVYDLVAKRTVYLNQRGAALLGYAPETIRAEQPDLVTSAMHPDDVPRLRAYHAQQLAHLPDGQMAEFEYRMRHVDGAWHWYRSRDKVFRRTIDGRVQQVIGTVSDITAHRTAEARLQFQASALAQVSDAVIVIDNQEHITWMNATAARQYGVDPARMLGQPLSAIYQYRWLRPEDQTSAYAALAETGHWRGENIHIKRDGEQIYVESTVSTLADDTGQPTGMLAVIRDVSERKRTEAALRASEEKFAKVFHAGPLVIAITSLADGRFIEVNETFVQMTGYTRAETLGRTPVEIGLWVDPAQRVAGLAQLRAGRFRRNTEAWFRMKDGSERICLIAAQLLELDGQTCVLTVLTDITEHKQTEKEKEHLAEQLALEQRRLALILKHLPAGVLIADATGRLIFSNPEVERIFQHPFIETPDIEGYRAWQLFDPNTGEEFPLDRMPMARTLTTGETVVGEEMKLLRGDGTWAYASVNSAPVQDDAGQIVLGVAAFIDITARRQAEEELRRLNATLEQRVDERTAELARSNRELDQFAYIASHDLRSPLRGIEHLVNFISEDADEVLLPSSKHHLDLLRGRVKRMDTLLTDLLAYSRASRQRHAREPVALAALLHGVVDFLTLPPGFHVAVIEPMPTLLAERTPLETIFRNLISNAVRHHDHPSEGRVTTTAADQGEWIEFAVADNGPGIEPAFHARIFEMFQTLKPRDQVEGSGIGLAIVKRLIEGRNGRIWVESSPGHGATFRFTWPK